MIKFAKILSIDSNKVLLKLDSSSGCSKCTKNCSDGFLKFLFHKNNNVELEISLKDAVDQDSLIKDNLGFFSKPHQINDLIGLKLNEKQLFLLAFMLYGVPLLIMLLMLILGIYIFTYIDMNGDLGGIVGLIIGMYCSRIFSRLNSNKFQPKIDFFK